MGDSVDLLRKSVGGMSQIKGSNFKLTMSDMQTWISAAFTDDDTCMTGNMKNIVKEQNVNIAHLTSNVLALINNYATSVHG